MEGVWEIKLLGHYNSWYFIGIGGRLCEKLLQGPLKLEQDCEGLNAPSQSEGTQRGTAGL